jgi:hypothetical protein
MNVTRRRLMLMLMGAGALSAYAEQPGERGPVIPRVAPETTFAEWVTAFHAQPPIEAGLDTCLPVVFHGSPAAFDRVKPYRASRGTRTLTRWQGTAIFASADPRVALFYTYNHRVPNFHCGLNLTEYSAPDEPISYVLTGGRSEEQAMNTLFGDPTRPDTCRGYIYVLGKQYFYREPGVGTMECISRDPASNLWRLEVNRREEIARLIQGGRIQLSWA